jgi:hypothetical protein
MDGCFGSVAKHVFWLSNIHLLCWPGFASSMELLILSILDPLHSLFLINVAAEAVAHISSSQHGRLGPVSAVRSPLP